jgi:hypothetical protein
VSESSLDRCLPFVPTVEISDLKHKKIDVLRELLGRSVETDQIVGYGVMSLTRSDGRFIHPLSVSSN